MSADKRSFSVRTQGGGQQNGKVEKLTSANGPTSTNFPHDVNGDGINLLVNPIQRSLIYKLHGNADVRVLDERAI